MPRGCRNALIIALVVGAAVLFAVALGGALYYAGRHGPPGGKMVALIEVKGPIFDVDTLLREIQTRRRDKRVKAMVVRIDSPGGAVGPSQELFREIQKTRENGTYVVASMGSVAASGGFYVACAADRVFANPGTLTGSIGVIAQFPNVEGLMDKIGVSWNTIKTGKYKDLGSSFRSMTEEEQAVLQATLFDMLAQFTEHVAAGRNMELDAVRKLADGRVFTGRQALGLGLIDEEGTLLDAIDHAAQHVGITGEPQVLRRRERTFGPFKLAESLTRLLPQATPPLRPGVYYLWP